MRPFLGSFWKLDVPPEWEVSTDSDGVTLRPPSPQGLGVLRISSVRKREGLVSDQDLRDIMEMHEAPSELAEPVELGWFRGYHVAAVDEELGKHVRASIIRRNDT